MGTSGKSAKRMFKYDLLIPLVLAEMLILLWFYCVFMNFAHTSRSRTRIELVAFTVCHSIWKTLFFLAFCNVN